MGSCIVCCLTIICFVSVAVCYVLITGFMFGFYFVCVGVFVIFCVLFLLMYTVVSFLFVHKFTDHCHREEIQLQLINIIHIFFFPPAQQPKPGLGRPAVDVSSSLSLSLSHTHTRYSSSERVISSSQRPLPTQNTSNTRDEHPCPQRMLKSRSKHLSSFRPTP